MRYAEVSVNSPAAQRRTFSYSIPSGLDVQDGQAVWIPFGNKLLQGVVMYLTDTPAVEQTRDIEGLIDAEPILSLEQIQIALWISRYYLTPLFSAVSLMLPPGYDRKAVTFINPTVPDGLDLSTCTVDESSLITILLKDGRSTLKSIEKQLGQKKSQRIVSSLVKKGYVSREYELESVKAKPKIEKRLAIAMTSEKLESTINELKNAKSTLKQGIALEWLAEYGQPVTTPDVLRLTEYSRSTINTLVQKGLVRQEEVEVRRDPLADNPVNISYPLTLTSSQEKVFYEIAKSIPAVSAAIHQTFLPLTVGCEVPQPFRENGKRTVQ